MDYESTKNYGGDTSLGNSGGMAGYGHDYGSQPNTCRTGSRAGSSSLAASAGHQGGCLASGCLMTVVGFALGAFLILMLICALPFMAISVLDFDDPLESSEASSPFTVKKALVSHGDDESVIAVIDVSGIISRTGDRLSSMTSTKLVKLLECIRKDTSVRAIVLDMDTPGGEVVAADEIHQGVQACRSAGLPVVTCMHSLAASGGYYIASGTDWIVANRMTMTGSIGVIMNGMNVKGLMDKCGLESMVFKSGSMKDALSPMRKMSEEERAYIQHMISETFEEFVAIVATGRKKHFKNIQAVKDAPFADGRVLSGKEAVTLGLVDQLGTFTDAVDQAARLAGLKNPTVTRYGLSLSWSSLLLDVMGGQRLTMTVSGMPKVAMQPGKLYFLAPECMAEWN